MNKTYELVECRDCGQATERLVGVDASHLPRYGSWEDDICTVLTMQAFDQAHLSALYDAVARWRAFHGRSVTREFRCTIRRALDRSAFCRRLGGGVWRFVAIGACPRWHRSECRCELDVVDRDEQSGRVVLACSKCGRRVDDLVEVAA